MMKKMKIPLFVSTEYTNVTDTQTDGQTDGRTPYYGIDRAYASHRAAITWFPVTLSV